MFDWLVSFRKMARSAPQPDGPAKNGCAQQTFNADQVVILAFDSRGRVHKLHDGTIDGGTFVYLDNPRQQVLNLLDQFDVQDFTWPRSIP